MSNTTSPRKPWLKRILLAGLVVFFIGAAVVYYFFTQKFEDTATTKADFTANALDLIAEFAKSDTAANSKYTEKIIVVHGTDDTTSPFVEAKDQIQEQDVASEVLVGIWHRGRKLTGSSA
jgi:predicted membrane-bound mannosyltransferase